MTLVSQSEYARRLGVTTAAVSQWKKANRLVMDGRLVDVEKSDARLKKYRAAGLPEAVERPETVKQEPKPVKQIEERNGKVERLTVAEITQRLKSMDFTRKFDPSKEAQEVRARLAAECVGWVAVQSDLRDDGHWGGFQLRSPESMKIYGIHPYAITGGFGYEMDAMDVLLACRNHLTELTDDDGEAWREEEDDMEVRTDLLHLLARPLYLTDTPKDN
jgi:predicted transcriptional regulator